jgi:uncharacterized protein YdcH (DUF465 family)
MKSQPEDKRLQILKERHQQLDDDVDELQARHFLIPLDQARLKVLKMQRLRAREAMDKFLLHEVSRD